MVAIQTSQDLVVVREYTVMLGVVVGINAKDNEGMADKVLDELRLRCGKTRTVSPL